MPKNFSFQECLWFLDRNYDDCLHEVRPNSVRKGLLIHGELILIEITKNDNHLIINFHQFQKLGSLQTAT